MSTNYYRPAEPVTRVVVKSHGWSSERFVHLQIQTVNAGVLHMGYGALKDLALLLIRAQPTAAIWLKTEDATVLRIEDWTLRHDDTLISEHGDFTTLGALIQSCQLTLRWPSGDEE